LDAERVLKAERAQGPAKDVAATVKTVGEYDVTRHAVGDCSRDEIECEFLLGLEHDVVGDLALLATQTIVRPALGQVQRKVDGHMRRARRDAQAYDELTIGNLASAAGVLTLHSDRVRPLLEKPRVVDRPRLNRLM